MLISEYPHIKESKKGTEVSLESFLIKIQSGTYQDLILKLRTLDKSSPEYKILKESLPYATISGTFAVRSEAGLRAHSGYLAIDIDDCEPEESKEKIKNDKHIYAAFTSCGGNGLCIIFKIHPLKHLASFDAITEYLYKHYGLVADQACKDISRARFVSFDPHMIVNEKASEFKDFPKAKPGKKTAKPVKEIVYVKSDFDDIILQIENNGTDITGDYNQWLRIGFAIADKFGESGRTYFHIVSRQGTTYTEQATNRQYTSCINANNTGVTIATFYWICKEHNISIVSDNVREISRRAYAHKRAGGTIVAAMEDIKDENRELVADIVNQVFTKNVKIDSASDIESGRIWMINRGLRRNSITDQLHLTDLALTDTEKKAIELEMREQLPDLDRSDIALLLRSSNVPIFNEIFTYFNNHVETKGTGSIARLAKSLNSPTGAGTDYVERFLTKWLVGGIACLYKDESHTMLILCGEHHGDGKSFFFKNLLPKELRHLCACKDLSDISGKSSEKKDFEIAITKSWLIFDDEMAGKTKRDHKAIRAMLAKSYSDVRGSYKEVEEHRKRIAFFGGTSNDFEVISDYGDNRRIIPIQILQNGIDQKTKDIIQPVEYIMEAYHLYHAGYDYRILNKEIEFLNAHTQLFQEQTSELDLIRTEFMPVTDGCLGEYMTGTDVKKYLESDSKITINISKLKDAFRSIGVPQQHETINGIYARYYYVCKRRQPMELYVPKRHDVIKAEPENKADELPF